MPSRKGSWRSASASAAWSARPTTASPLSCRPRNPGRDLEKILKDQFPDLEIKSTEVVEGREKVVLKFQEKRIADIKKTTLDQSLETIRNRVDQFGVSEPEIIPQGEDRILIQLPGIKDPKRAIDLIGRTALLEFKLVDEEHSLEDALKGKCPRRGHPDEGPREREREHRDAPGPDSS